MSEHIITIKQLATVIKKCNGWPLSDKDGNPIVNPLEIDRDEVVELPEIVRCRDCKHFVTNIHGSYCKKSITTLSDANGFCAWGERRGE